MYRIGKKASVHRESERERERAKDTWTNLKNKMNTKLWNYIVTFSRCVLVPSVCVRRFEYVNLIEKIIVFIKKNHERNYRAPSKYWQYKRAQMVNSKWMWKLMCLPHYLNSSSHYRKRLKVAKRKKKKRKRSRTTRKKNSISVSISLQETSWLSKCAFQTILQFLKTTIENRL